RNHDCFSVRFIAMPGRPHRISGFGLECTGQRRSGHGPRAWSILWPKGSQEMTSCRCSGDVQLISTLALILVTAPHLGAQWVKPPAPGAPRTADGKVDLRGPAPRAADGKLDLSGM